MKYAIIYYNITYVLLYDIGWLMDACGMPGKVAGGIGMPGVGCWSAEGSLGRAAGGLGEAWGGLLEG